MGKATIHMLALAFLSISLVIKGTPTSAATAAAIAGSYKPRGSVEYRRTGTHSAVTSSPRRVLEPFKLCRQCRCCASEDSSSCSLMPCCFGIDCNLPDKPYGVCAFVPTSCNCTACG